MTSGFWRCQECGHEVLTRIYYSLDECPECGAEHEVIGHVQGLHVCHTLPIYKLVKESVEEATINQHICFASGDGNITYHCYTKEFYEFLNEKFKDQENIKVIPPRKKKD